MSFTFTFAQKANVRLAKDKALNEDKPDFKGAREAIKLALQDSTTKNLAETWYVAGLIGNKQNEAELKKAYLPNQKYDTIAKGTALMESYNYFIQAIKYDNLPDAKGKVKPKYAKDIKAFFKDYYTTPQNLIGWGAYLYGKEKYKDAVKAFEAYLEIPKLPIMNNEIKMDTTYDLITYYAAVSASGAKMHEKAVNYFEGLKTKSYSKSDVYRSLALEYLQGKDTVNYLKTLQEGIQKITTVPWFVQNMIDFYIHNNKTKDALLYLNTAIEREPGIARYYYIKGFLCVNLEDFDEANKAINKSIEIDPTNSDAYEELGRSYYNKAVKMSLEANKIKDTNLYKKEEAKIDDVFKQAIPYYKKAIEMNPKNIDYLSPLKQLYYRLQMDTEYSEIAKQIKELQK